MDTIEELKKDRTELEQLLNSQATREQVKQMLIANINVVSKKILNLEEIEKKKSSKSSAAAQAPKGYVVKLTNYAWDQTPTALKIYVTLKNVQNLPPENVNCAFNERSFDLTVNDLDGKNYLLTIKNLLEKIDPSKSTWKVKNDTVLVTLAKVSSKNWSHVTELEKKAKEMKTPKLDGMDGGDPSAGLMQMMKKMYESGDDEMKRTIAKAWTESNEKRGMEGMF